MNKNAEDFLKNLAEEKIINEEILYGLSMMNTGGVTSEDRVSRVSWEISRIKAQKRLREVNAQIDDYISGSIAFLKEVDNETN